MSTELDSSISPSIGTSTSLASDVSVDKKSQRRRKRKRSAPTPAVTEGSPRYDDAGILWWKVSQEHVPVASEEIMISVLVRWGAKERGMIKDQPPFRLQQIRQKLKQAPGLRLDQALSLRRHHIKLLNPERGMTNLGLGRMEHIRVSAEIFERIVETFLIENKIEHWNEKEQQKRSSSKLSLTPDFIFPTAVTLKTFRHTRGGSRHVLEEHRIFWLEAKMFYGASTIPDGSDGAVGTILKKMSRYVESFGSGAIVFMHGCGDRFAEELATIGVTALSGADFPKQLMTRLWDHQKTWCAKDGFILP